MLQRVFALAIVASLLAPGTLRAQEAPAQQAPADARVPYFINLRAAGDFTYARVLLKNFRGRVPAVQPRRMTTWLQQQLDRYDRSLLSRMNATFTAAVNLNRMNGRPLRKITPRHRDWARLLHAEERHMPRAAAPIASEAVPAAAAEDAPAQDQRAVRRTVSDVHAVPFASKGNRIELTVAGASGEVTVTAKETPAWVELAAKVRRLDTDHTAGEEAAGEKGAGAEKNVAIFTFAVSESAPVGQTQSIVFEIADIEGVRLEREIRLKVAAPERFELLGNYPNPFRRATQIGYQLPEAAEVTIRVYDLLGRQVALLEEGRQDAGGHAASFDAARLSSGVYLYVVEMDAEDGPAELRHGKMVVVR